MTYTNWKQQNLDTLKELFHAFQADTGDTQMSFAEFCFGMYRETKYA